MNHNFYFRSPLYKEVIHLDTKNRIKKTMKSHLIKWTLWSLAICTICVTSIFAQDSPSAYYGFNVCDLLDESGLNGDALSTTVQCDCGVKDSSLILDGNEALLFPEEVKEFLTGDYSISFYFNPENTQPIVDLLSIRKSCNQDSMLSVRYISFGDRVELSMAADNPSLTTIRGDINPDLCWHHVVIVKSRLNLSLYLDNRFIETVALPFDIPFSKLAPLAVSNSACVGISEDRLNGRIDEFKVFDRALSQAEINENYLFPDQVINADTTIFLGDALQLNTGKTCAFDITWTPAAGLDDDAITNPIASPLSTTTYEVRFTSAECVFTDDVTINILDLDQIQCDSLLLPNAFTPNNDNINDDFGISNTFIIDEMESFKIMDRWGGVVFETNNKDMKWDGSVDGQVTNPGMYLYKVNYSCQGETYVAVGNFSLIK